MKYRIWIQRYVWASWWIGTALIVASWFDVVSRSIGWVGFGAACTASLISVVVNRYWRPPAAPEEEASVGGEESRVE